MKEKFVDLEGLDLEVVGQEEPLTAPKVVFNLLAKHPEITQLVVASYPVYSHGERRENIYDEYIPRVYLEDELEQGQWRRTRLNINEVVAVGSVVDVCSSPNCVHTKEEHNQEQLWLWKHWHDGFSLPWGSQRSFIFLDIEQHNQVAFRNILAVLNRMDADCYVLESGRGYHMMVDKVTDLDEFPESYGQIISLFGEQFNDRALKGWGDDLIRSKGKPSRIENWCADVMEIIGHAEDPIYQLGTYVHILDLRHIAHSLRSVLAIQEWSAEHPIEDAFRRPATPRRAGGAYLRISPGRYSSPPVLVAQKELEEMKVFDLKDSPFVRPEYQQPLL